MIFSKQSITCMIIVALFCTAVPFIFLGYYRAKKGAKLSSFFIGMGFYFLFAFIGEGLLNYFVFNVIGMSKILTRDAHPVIYALYGAVTAGAFEEIGKYVGLSKCMKNRPGKENAFLYGVGHGGLETIAYGSSLFMGNIVLAFMVNSLGADEYFKKLGYTGDILIKQKDALSTLIAMPSIEYVSAGFERVLALVLQASLTILVFTAINHKKFKALFPAAIALHIIGYLPTNLTQVGVIPNLALTFCLTGTIVVIVAIYAFKLFHKLPDETETAPPVKFPKTLDR